MPHHAKAAGWPESGDRMWFHRCDQCGKRRLVDTYFEIYPPLHSEGDEAGWWWACASCLVSIVSDQLEAATVVLHQYEQWEAALLMDDEAWGSGWDERTLPVLTQALLDRLIEIQGPREEVIHGKVAGGEITINRARRLLGLDKIEYVAGTPEDAEVITDVCCSAKRTVRARLFAQAEAGGYDEVFGPAILDQHGCPLVAVDHLAEDAEELRDLILEALQA